MPQNEPTPDPRATLELCEKLYDVMVRHGNGLTYVTRDNLESIIRDLRRLVDLEAAVDRVSAYFESPTNELNCLELAKPMERLTNSPPDSWLTDLLDHAAALRDRDAGWQAADVLAGALKPLADWIKTIGGHTQDDAIKDLWVRVRDVRAADSALATYAAAKSARGSK